MRSDRSTKAESRMQSGMLSLSEGCPALMCRDGHRFWLEMERIPMDLIDQAVDVEGIIHQQNLIVVERIRGMVS